MASESEYNVTTHYQRNNLFETIVERLDLIGVDMDNITRTDITSVDEFHIRGAAVSKELAGNIPLNNKKVLDIGCGIGGPCRMLADEHNCLATGVDLNPEFVRTATKLSDLVSLSDKTNFVLGSALDLPFSDHSFDVAWTQHVQMNVADKNRFYSETFRVLKPGGYFLYYDIFSTGLGDLIFPVPWAEDERISFLFSAEEMNRILTDLGGQQVSSTDQTVSGIDFFEKLRDKIRKDGPPAIGLNLLMGTSTSLKLGNLLQALKDGLLRLESGVFVKTN